MPGSDLPEAERNMITGVQANLWTEHIPTPEYAEYMLYPRALALAEIGWNGTKTKNYPEFKTRALAQVEHLKAEGVNPSAHITIHERLFASCRIIAVVSMVIGYLGTHSLMLHRLHLFLALTNLLLQLEWIHALSLQVFYLRQGTGLELRIVLGLGSVPSYLSQSQGTRLSSMAMTW